MRCKVLTLQWPKDINPSELTQFESQARKLRYQALGTACREHGIGSLLLGHHADDQAETVLMRLAQGQKASGLRGISPSGEIPECWGMHGVHLSGAMEAGLRIKEARLSATQKKRRAKRMNQDLESLQAWSGADIEHGGVRITESTYIGMK